MIDSRADARPSDRDGYIRRLDETIVRRAIQWKLKLHNGGADQPHLQQHWRQWLQQHPDHRLAWQRLDAMGREFQDCLATLPDTRLATPILEQTAASLQRRNALKLLTLCMATGATGLLAYRALPWREWGADYRTAIGERRTVTLADGTQLLLNTDSAVDIRFSPQQRLIVLQRGEIFIDSGDDPGSPVHRPLRVQSRNAVLEALGTRFLVRDGEQGTTLRVEEGRVAIRDGNGAAMIAVPGESYTVSGTGITQISRPAMDIAGWTRGVLVVNDMRLADFVRELSRYRAGYLGCDPAVADLRLSGVFQLNQGEAPLEVLAHLLPVQIVYRTRWWARVLPAA
jgi:ferric-dicitrate binding protein FerR (iron transport regulator)